MGRKRNNRGGQPPPPNNNNNRPQQKSQQQTTTTQPTTSTDQNGANTVSSEIAVPISVVDAIASKPVPDEPTVNIPLVESIDENATKSTHVEEKGKEEKKVKTPRVVEQPESEKVEDGIGDTNTAKRKRNKNRKRNKGGAGKETTPPSDSNQESDLIATDEPITSRDKTTSDIAKTTTTPSKPIESDLRPNENLVSETKETQSPKELPKTNVDVPPPIQTNSPKTLEVDESSTIISRETETVEQFEAERDAGSSKVPANIVVDSTDSTKHAEKVENKRKGKNKQSGGKQVPIAVPAPKNFAEVTKSVQIDQEPAKQIAPSVASDSKIVEKPNDTHQDAPSELKSPTDEKEQSPSKAIIECVSIVPDRSPHTCEVEEKKIEIETAKADVINSSNQQVESKAIEKIAEGTKPKKETPPKEPNNKKQSSSKDSKRNKNDRVGDAVQKVVPNPNASNIEQELVKQTDAADSIKPDATEVETVSPEEAKVVTPEPVQKEAAKPVPKKQKETMKSAAPKKTDLPKNQTTQQQAVPEHRKIDEPPEKPVPETIEKPAEVLPNIQAKDGSESKVERLNATPPSTPTSVTPKDIRKVKAVHEDETSRIWKILEEASKSLEPVEIEIDEGPTLLLGTKANQSTDTTPLSTVVPSVKEVASNCAKMEMLNSVLLEKNVKESKKAPATPAPPSPTIATVAPVETVKTQPRKSNESKNTSRNARTEKPHKSNVPAKKQLPVATEPSSADVEIPLDMSIISNASGDDALSSPLDDAVQTQETVADSKNVQGSDFVPSVEQSTDGAESLVATVATPIDHATTQSFPGNDQPSGQNQSKPQGANSRPKDAPKPKNVVPTSKPSAANGNQKTTTEKKPSVPPKPEHLVSSKNKSKSPVSTANTSAPHTNRKETITMDECMVDDDDEDEEIDYIEYKFMPRQVFICSICQTCKTSLQSDVRVLCPQCQMVAYCSAEHLQVDAAAHKDLCTAIVEIARKRGGHIYNNARVVNSNDYRSLRVHTLNICENLLNRPLQTFEREILLFPRLCGTANCREWRHSLLTDCPSCHQVAFCIAHPEHLLANHQRWCKSFQLYEKLVIKQSVSGRIEPVLPTRIIGKSYALPNSIENIFKDLYENYSAIKDDCMFATVTQLATAPLTAYFAVQKTNAIIGESFTIHLVGAELQFEADILDIWETFFLHLSPKLIELTIVFCGPELNAENLPLDIISRIRMCRACRQHCRIVKFDFQCGKLYHDYANSSSFKKPDLICFFNPGLHRTTGFNGLDTWPETIRIAASMACPILITSYTEFESPRDLERFQMESTKAGHAPLSVVHPPQINQYSSQRPERNFISDEVAPLIFKNFCCFILK